jgi:hypothetical protein
MGEVTREELAAMTDQELLAYEREHHGDPYMTLLEAKGMRRVALQFWHLGRPVRRRTERLRRRRAVACFRSCFRPTPLLPLSRRGGGDRKSAMTAARSPDRAD